MASPNAEQLMAIEHKGGVLLSAGAGSGKTFVLVQHIIFRITDLWQQFGHDKLQFSINLKDFFSQTVLMTFTNKAAGEIRLRLYHKIKNLVDEADDAELSKWSIALEAVELLTITTIHGLCLKLIKKNYFPGVSPDLELISNYKLRKKIERIYQAWLEDEFVFLKQNYHDVLETVFFTNQEGVIEAIEKIFLDPSLRTEWAATNEDILDNESDILKKIISLAELDFILASSDLTLSEDVRKYKWADLIIQFQQIKKKIGIYIYESKGLIELNQFFADMGRFPPGPKNGQVDDEVIQYFEKIKELRSFLKDIIEDLQSYTEEKNGVIKQWYKAFVHLIKYVENHYTDDRFITFSDMEYIVYKHMCLGPIPEVLKLIQQDFRYLVVDEFQDTSVIQFKIIQSILDGNLDKLFCVGDIKQAIYGFRGGEISVFINCAEKIKNNYQLSNNYRSVPGVIEFNNSFYKKIFSLGQNFEGIDHQAVTFTPQKYVTGEISPSVRVLECELTSSEKWSNDKINQTEADLILEQILAIRQADEKAIVAVLYKNLTPSPFLIQRLIKANVGFTAQVKIPLKEDPIIGIFFNLIEMLCSPPSDNRTSFSLISTLAYLKYLSIDTSLEQIKNAIDLFLIQRNVWGIFNAFSNFLEMIGISNSNFHNNSEKIFEFCIIGQDNHEKIWKLLRAFLTEQYTFSFQYGDASERVLLMTAHASKGLEFPYVFLAGIYTNGRTPPDTSLVGIFPGSFRWRKSSNSKEVFKTPQYIWEKLANAKREFSESKRLLYVATTRPKNVMIFTHITFLNEKGEKVSLQKNSWSVALHKWLQEKVESLVTIVDCNKTNKLENFEHSLNSSVLFQIDDLGIAEKKSLSGDNNSNLIGLSAELSVTGLATLADCPTKFLFKNIYKISPEDAGRNYDDNSFHKESLESEEIKISSKNALSKGLEVHRVISYLITHNWSMPLNTELSSKNKEDIEWVKGQLQSLSLKYNLISETPIKFNFFSQMISGTPDLVLTDKKIGNVVEIWDFKTGKVKNEEDDKSYRFQLMCYALGLMKNNFNQELRLVLCYVEHQKIMAYSISGVEIVRELYQVWLKLSNLQEKKLSHCPNCDYSSFCHPNS